MLNKLFSLEKKIFQIEKKIIIILLFLMIALSFLQFSLRFFFHSGIIWMDIFLRYIVLNTAIIAAAIVSYENRHFAMDAVFNFINTRYHRALKIISNIFVMIVLIILFMASYKFVKMEFLANSEAFIIGEMKIKSYIMEISLPLSFFLMLFHTFLNCFKTETETK